MTAEGFHSHRGPWTEGCGHGASLQLDVPDLSWGQDFCLYGCACMPEGVRACVSIHMEKIMSSIFLGYSLTYWLFVVVAAAFL